jgi:hypothetical protein
MAASVMDEYNGVHFVRLGASWALRVSTSNQSGRAIPPLRQPLSCHLWRKIFPLYGRLQICNERHVLIVSDDGLSFTIV